MRAALNVSYVAGLRAAEVVALKVSDINSKRMRIRVEQGKGRKDREALLSPHLLTVLRTWWKMARPQVWLFPNRLTPFEPVTPRSLNRAFHYAARRTGITKPAWPGVRKKASGRPRRSARAWRLASPAFGWCCGRLG